MQYRSLQKKQKQNKNVVILPNQDTKSGSWKSCSAKTTSRQEKMREWKNPPRKTKNVKDLDIQTREICERLRLRIVFAYLLLCECPIWFQKNVLFNPNREGRRNATAWGKGGLFWCFLAQVIQKTFFPKWGSFQFKFPHSSNPPIPHPQEKSCPRLI